jgi:hypothetical protein
MNLQTLLQNKHTTGVGIIYLIASAIGHIGDIWYPEHAEQIDDTVRYIKESCFVYGMTFAGAAVQKTADDKKASLPFEPCPPPQFFAASDSTSTDRPKP